MAETASNKEFETFVDLNIGSVASVDPQVAIDSFYVDHSGSTVNGTGTYYMKLYMNGRTTEFDTLYAPIDSVPYIRKWPGFGQLKQLLVRIGAAITSPANVNDFRVKGLLIRHTTDERKGPI